MKSKEKKNDMAAEQLINPQPEAVEEPEKQEEAAPRQNQSEFQMEIEKLHKQVKENLECWQRERADFNNYKRRIEREQDMLSQNVAATTIKKFLVILDDMDRAMKLRPTSGDGAAWADGMELVYRKLISLVESSGVTQMQVENEAFDPTRHEAITHEDSPDHQSGEIIEVVQQGYMIGDRVLRPALVRVAR
jgi:molecular chaperone GrpE